jgi:hypothetical protein
VERARLVVAAGADTDWQDPDRARDRGEATALEQRLLEQTLPARRRWRFVTIGALTEEQAEKIASTVRDGLPEADVEIQPTLDLPSPSFVLIRSWL